MRSGARRANRMFGARIVGVMACAAATILLPQSALAEEKESQAQTETESTPERSVAIEPKPWDQERMKELSSTLAKQLRDVKNTFRKSALASLAGTPQEAAAQKLYSTLQVLDRSGRQFAANIESGKGRAETENIARNIGSLLRDADVKSRRLASDYFVKQKVLPAMETINQIAPYYGVSALYDVERGEMLPRATE